MKVGRLQGRDETSRALAEWITFGVACVIVLAVAGLMLAQAFESAAPASPVAAQSGAIRHDGGQFYVPVDVTNHGDTTAAGVQVTAELTIDGVVTTGDHTIDFLAGDEIEHLKFVFADDPATGSLSIRVTGFSDP
ncbi:MAG: TIGR02588 family protein [Ilumatobacteraceae bacterium]